MLVPVPSTLSLGNRNQKGPLASDMRTLTPASHVAVRKPRLREQSGRLIPHSSSQAGLLDSPVQGSSWSHCSVLGRAG